MRGQWLLVSVLLLGLMLGAAASLGMAQGRERTIAGAVSFTQDLPPPRPFGEDLDNIPRLNSAPAKTESSNGVATPDMVPWSKLVFQSYRDQNWEIYLADGDGSNQVRLTSYGKSDVQPRLNRGCTRVVFSSYRRDGYEICTIGADGSGWTQLTVNRNNDVQPAWSPDGTKIAFQSYRDGQAEVYVMNADGSGQTRLTWDGGYDGEPCWSPDGAQIAFTSSRSGQYHIWLMNANGSGKRQLSNQPYGEHPTWSPNGSQIAYDSDGDGDGRQELWLMNADGTNQRQIVDVYDRDAWAGSWSPDGRYVSFTQIIFIQYRGNWYWTDAYLYAWDSVNESTTMLGQDDRAWRPDMQTTDIEPPMARIHPLPRYSRSWDTQVSWSGEDLGEGASGLRSFDVQVREVAGDWSEWLVDTPSTSGLYWGTSGQKVMFRVRGRDLAYNNGVWAPDDDVAETWIYSHLLSGHVKDTRGIPLAGAEITIEPVPFNLNDIDGNGAYQAYLSQSGMTKIAASAAGFAPLPKSSWNVDYDQDVAFHLPPSDDIVTNGGFEASGGSLAHWDASGTPLPTVTSVFRHTGQAAAFLGRDAEPQLTPPEPIHGRIYSFPNIVVDHTGVVHMVYLSKEVGPDYNEPFYTYRNVQGQWATPIKVGTCGRYTDNCSPVIAVTPSGDIHASWYGEKDVYSGEREVYYSRLRPNGSWTDQVVIGPGGDNPSIAADARGGLHIVYHRWKSHTGENEILSTYRSPSGAWTKPKKIADGAVPLVTIGQSGIVHLMWWSEDKIYYSQKRPNGDWGAAELVSSLVGPRGPQGIVEDQKGNLHALWFGELRNGYYATRSLHGVWSEPALVPKFNGYGDLDLAVDSIGTVYAVYGSSSPAELGTYFAYKPCDGNWSKPQKIAQEDRYPRIVVDRGDNLHIVYECWDNNCYRTNALSSVSETCAISQAIVIPHDMHRPTLSLIYRLRGVMQGNQGGSRVFVSNELTSTEVISISESADWTHAWVDLSPWEGQTITLTVESRTAVGEHYTQLVIDEVSLGSWQTPIPMVITPNQIEAGVSSVITITGENFFQGASVRLTESPMLQTGWISSRTMTSTVPASLPFGIYRVWVVNPGGQEGSLPDSLIVGDAVFLPIVLEDAK